MKIKNTTKRASKAIHLLSMVDDILVIPINTTVDHELLKSLLDIHRLVSEAQQELIMILAQDNDIEIES